MKSNFVAILYMLCLATQAYGSEANLRFAKSFQFPGMSEVIVIAEGDFEPRSVGSYSLRVYGGAAKQSPTDDFIGGVIRPRNGTIDAVRFEAVDGDDSPEIVVITRSVGSGGYLSADAFSYQSGSLEWILSVSDLDKEADPIQALRDKARAPAKVPSREPEMPW